MDEIYTMFIFVIYYLTTHINSLHCILHPYFSKCNILHLLMLHIAKWVLFYCMSYRTMKYPLQIESCYLYCLCYYINSIIFFPQVAIHWYHQLSCYKSVAF